MFIIFILYHILYIISQIKKQKNQFIPLPIEEGDFLIRLLNIIFSPFIVFIHAYVVFVSSILDIVCLSFCHLSAIRLEMDFYIYIDLYKKNHPKISQEIHG